MTLNILLDETDHSYTFDGRPTVGVTTIIKEAGLADWRFVHEFYRDRGSRAHKAIHFNIECDLDLNSCADDCVGYVISATDFLRAHSGRTIAVERRVGSVSLWYAGTLDWIGLMDSCRDVTCCPRPFRDALTLLDWKTSKQFHPATAIQTVAYADAYYEETKSLVRRRICVLVDIDGGGARQREYDVRDHVRDRNAWRAALTCCAWRRENKVDSIYSDESIN